LVAPRLGGKGVSDLIGTGRSARHPEAAVETHQGTALKPTATWNPQI